MLSMLTYIYIVQISVNVYVVFCVGSESVHMHSGIGFPFLPTKVYIRLFEVLQALKCHLYLTSTAVAYL